MSKLKWMLDTAAVSSEPGLTNAQLMLTNSDLRPGESTTEATPGLMNGSHVALPSSSCELSL